MDLIIAGQVQIYVQSERNILVNYALEQSQINYPRFNNFNKFDQFLQIFDLNNILGSFASCLMNVS